MTAAALKTLSRSAQRLAAHCAVNAALLVVSSSSGIEAKALRRRVDPNLVKHGDQTAHRIAAARNEVVYLAVCRFGLPLRATGAAFDLSPEAVRKAIARVEDLRSDPKYDRRLDEMELELMGAA